MAFRSRQSHFRAFRYYHQQALCETCLFNNSVDVDKCGETTLTNRVTRRVYDMRSRYHNGGHNVGETTLCQLRLPLLLVALLLQQKQKSPFVRCLLATELLALGSFLKAPCRWHHCVSCFFGHGYCWLVRYGLRVLLSLLQTTKTKTTTTLICVFVK